MLALGAQGLFDGVAVTRGRVMVLVEGGRIVAVDRSGAAPPPYAEVVELTDATLLAGAGGCARASGVRPHGAPAG